MNTTLLSLGSNEGDRMAWLDYAMKMIELQCGTITSRSSIYETAAWGITDQPDFLNMVIAVATLLEPEQLLQTILNIEIELGRHRSLKWGPRTIDIDILFYNNIILNTPDLIIPHPYLHERRFTLIPLAEIAKDYIHPILNKTMFELLSSSNDSLEVRKFA